MSPSKKFYTGLLDKNMSKLIFELVGWIGSLMIILAYLLNSFQFLSVDNLPYQLLNIFGSVFLIIDFYRKKVFAGLFLQIVWGTVALLAIFKILFVQ